MLKAILHVTYVRNILRCLVIVTVTMPRASRSRNQLSEKDKKLCRSEQKKLSIRRARAKMNEADLEKRRQDRERYQRKKKQVKIQSIKDYTPRHQRQIRKIWREKAKLRRQKKNCKNALRIIEQNTPPTSPSFSRERVGNTVVKRIENDYLRKRILQLES